MCNTSPTFSLVFDVRGVLVILHTVTVPWALGDSFVIVSSSFVYLVEKKIHSTMNDFLWLLAIVILVVYFS